MVQVKKTASRSFKFHSIQIARAHELGIIDDLGVFGRILIPDFEEETLVILGRLGEIGTILRK